MMKVAMVSEHASPLATLGGVDAGGQNVFVAALSRELASRGLEVSVFTRRDSPDLAASCRFCDGVTVEHLEAGPAKHVSKDDLFPYMDQFAAALAERWRRERPDLVHAHFWMSGYASLLAARPLGIPVTQTFHALGVVKRRHQGSMDTSPGQRLEIESRIAREADQVLPTCSDEVFELLRMGADYDRLTVVPCGVDLDQFRPHGPVEERPEGRSRLLYVGRLVRRKGIGNIISALPLLPETELVIAGGPAPADLDLDPEVVRLRQLARSHGVEDRVVFRGRVKRERLPALIRSADLLVSVPWYEPFGIAPLEAMACGVPVIASAVGGMIDSIVDRSTGIHVPPRDPERLAEAAAELLTDPQTARRYGRQGVQRVRRLYGWSRIGDLTLAAYESLLAASRRTDQQRLDSQAGHAHLRELSGAIKTLDAACGQVEAWGRELADRLLAGARVLTVGNGGSAAEAEHLSAELVGRFEGERRPFSAIPLHADGSSLTAISNDYGADQAFARQVEAHGRPGDVLIAFSTSGNSTNVLRAVDAARRSGLTSWCITGPAPNPLAEAADEAVICDARSTATIQEMHLVAVHMLCGAVDLRVRQVESEAQTPAILPLLVTRPRHGGGRPREAGL